MAVISAAALVVGAPTGAAGTPMGQAGGAANRRVVVILVDRVGITQLALSGGLQQIVANGGAALMGTATGPGDGGDAPLAAAATFSAGEVSVGPTLEDDPQGVQAGAPFESTPDGTIGNVYRARTGFPPGPAALVYPDIALLSRLNASATIGSSPSILGQAMNDAGIVTAAVGTSDLPGDPLRPAPIVAMDSAGRVDLGSTTTNLEQPAEVIPLVTDQDALQDATADALQRARFVVVDWGDTSRIDRILVSARDRLDEVDPSGQRLGDRLEDARASSVQDLSDFISFVRESLVPTRDILAVVTPRPPQAQQDAGLLETTIAVEGGGLPHGALTSASTGRDGYVSNADLAPSILNWLRVPIPDEMAGHPMRVVGGEAFQFPLQVAQDDARADARRARQRPWVLAACLVLWAAAVGAALLASERRLKLLEGSLSGARRGAGRTAGKVRRVPPEQDTVTPVRALLFAAAFLPLSLLILPLWWEGSTVLVSLQVVVASIVLGFIWAAGGRERTATGLGAIAVITVGLLLFDGLVGGPLTSRSIAGVRSWTARGYSGLGSLFAGVVVAGGLVAAGSLARATRRNARARWIVFGGVALVLALLSLPALGGSPVVGIPGVAGLLVMALTWSRRATISPRWRVAAIASGAALVVLGLVLLSLQVAAARPASPILASAPNAAVAFGEILLRRVLSAAGLLFASGWTVAFLAAVTALAYVDRRLRRPSILDAPRGRGLPTADRAVEATQFGLLVAAALAVVVSVSGAATAGVVLMAAAVLSCGAILDRVRGIRPRI